MLHWRLPRKVSGRQSRLETGSLSPVLLPTLASAALQVLSGTSKGLVNIQAGGEMAKKMM